MKQALKPILIGLAISLAIFLILLSGLMLFDLACHRKFDESSSLNCRGYRGKIAGEKKKNEVRVAIYGGSCAMGYGESSRDTIAAYLENILNGSSQADKTYTVLNLAATGERLCPCFEPAYRIFSYLNVDIPVFYFMNERIPDIPQNPTPAEMAKLKNELFRSAYTKRTGNFILRHFRYYFIFSTVLVEKYYRLRYGNVEEGYKKDKFFQGIVDVPPAFELNDRQSKSFYHFVKELTSKGKTVICALAPSESLDDPTSNERLKRYFRLVFGDDRKVIVADLAGIFLKGGSTSYYTDTEHYSKKGNIAIAQALSEYIKRLK